ncbi:growth-regulating factor 8-like isoform X1 [Primulina eburnea]|uniref:growth-regulating factor 8-like isoform X1 n=1 Tax=Primulina eburnea TaxID=1245227 RepID=UPI003C6BE1E8
MMEKGKERNYSSSSLDCDVGLSLKMQTESSMCKKPMPSPFYHYQFGYSCGGDGAGGGGAAGPIFFNASGGEMSGKSLFTASQWQELERQKMIHKYMMASIPVPPQLILPVSSLLPGPQSNTPAGLDSKFSTNRWDPEPWRCKRTDGKKWRCSRDVAPDHKYCERHSHKTRPRSRKHVEVSSYNSINSTFSQSLHNPASQFPTMVSATPYEQTRYAEWFTNSVDNSVSSNKSRNKNNVSAFQTQGNHGFMNLDPFSPKILENHHEMGIGQYCISILDSKIPSLRGNLSPNSDRTTQTTIPFIDTFEKEKPPLLPTPSSLTLSMSGRVNEVDEFDKNSHFGIEMIDSGRDTDGILKSQWINPVSWINSPPGGPLGEVLCLGNSSVARGHTNLAPAHGYNINSSKSSCGEHDSHALNYIG